MPTEADTCRKFVVPLLQSAGWDTDPHSIAEQRTITDGWIVLQGKGFIRKPPKRVDYLLRYTRDFPLAAVEAKVDYKKAADGVQQAKDYAQMLGPRFAYATNGPEIIEFDFATGLETKRTDYPTPEQLWQRYRHDAGLKDIKRSEIIQSLQERGIDFAELADTAQQPDADPFDLLCHLAFNAPLRTRRERAQALRDNKKGWFAQYGPEARQILEELLEKYAEHGSAQFVLPDVLKVPLVSPHGQIGDITKLFGGADRLRTAVTQLQSLLYAA